MKRIPLSRGRFALVDDEDFDRLNQWTWYCATNNSGRNSYAVRGVPTPKGKRMVKMQNEALGLARGKIVDHHNGDGLDNQKANLRPCTSQQNNMNRAPHKRNTTGLKGVYWNEKSRKWGASLGFNGKKVLNATFISKDNAALAYRLFSKLYFGEFAYAKRNVEAGASWVRESTAR